MFFTRLIVTRLSIILENYRTVLNTFQIIAKNLFFALFECSLPIFLEHLKLSFNT